jgi:hypothetical protein
MSDRRPTDGPHAEALLKRFATYGAIFGAAVGVALTALLRSTVGQPENFMIKTVVVVLIVAGFGAFVGVLVQAFLRAHRG